MMTNSIPRATLANKNKIHGEVIPVLACFQVIMKPLAKHMKAFELYGITSSLQLEATIPHLVSASEKTQQYD